MNQRSTINRNEAISSARRSENAQIATCVLHSTEGFEIKSKY